MLDIAVICLVITALLAYLNHRFVGMPTTIGVMAASLALSLLLIGLDAVGWRTACARMRNRCCARSIFRTSSCRGCYRCCCLPVRCTST